MIAGTEGLISTPALGTEALIIAPLKGLPVTLEFMHASTTASASSESDHHQMNQCVDRLIATDVSLESLSGLVIDLAAHVLLNSFMVGMVLSEANSCLISLMGPLVVGNQCDQTGHLALCHHQGQICLIDRSGSLMIVDLLALPNCLLVMTTFPEVPATTVGLT